MTQFRSRVFRMTQFYLTQGKGVKTPAMKERKSVTEVTVMETAASDMQRPILSGTDA